MWIDAHCHTKFSYDNWLEPLELIRRARAVGLDGICVTEHYSYEASAPIEALARQEGFLVLRGAEVSTDAGHLLIYGIEDDGWNVWGRDNYLPLQAVIDRVVELGGVCVPAHPYRELGVCSLLDRVFELQRISAVETHNGGNRDRDNELAALAAQRLGLAALGGSDCHKAATIGRCATEFLAPISDMAGFVAAVKAGACRANYFPAGAQ